MEIAKNGKGTIKDFGELRIYKLGRELTAKIYELSKSPGFFKDYILAQHIRKTAISVVSNIAEGFERLNNKEFIVFLFIAKGSCGEIRAQLDVAYDQKYLDEKTQGNLSAQYGQLGAMINKFILYLKKSEYTGLKHKPSD